MDSKGDLALGVSDSYILANFCQVRAGSERDVVQAVADASGLAFRVFGQYDVLVLKSINGIDNYQNRFIPGIRNSRTIVGFRFNLTRYSPPIEDWINPRLPILGFVFLELDKWYYSSQSGCPSGIHCYRAFLDALDNAGHSAGSVALYGGFGRSELYLLVQSTSFGEISRVVDWARGLRAKDCFPEAQCSDPLLPLFCRTRTIPMLSDNVSSPTTLLDNSEALSISINISCPSGTEAAVINYFVQSNRYQVERTYGAHDLLISSYFDTTDGLHPTTREVIDDLEHLRANWSDASDPPIETETRINTPIGERPESQIYSIEDDDDVDLPSTEQLATYNRALANNVLTQYSRLLASSTERGYSFLTYGMLSYLGYVSQMIAEYEDLDPASAHDVAKRYVLEGRLSGVAEAMELGLSQRLDSDVDPSLNYSSPPFPFADGIFSNLLALEFFISNIFDAWVSNQSDLDDEPTNWIGYPFFSDSFGFKLQYGEVISLPLDAIYNPYSGRGSWLTLTHEISHAFYLRLNVTETNKEHFHALQEHNFSDQIVEKTLGLDAGVHNEIFELFAHWFDFYHFYEEDIDFYLRTIWRSWDELSIVHISLSEYFFRSFVLFLHRDRNTLLSHRVQNDEYQAFLGQSWDEHFTLVTNLGLNVSNKIKEKLPQRRDDFFTLFHRYAPIFDLFHDKYRFDGFRKSVNSEPSMFYDQLDGIRQGLFIAEPIENPYLLVKALVERSANDEQHHKFQQAVALLISLKNQVSFLESSD